MAHRVVAMKAVPIIASGFVVCLVLFPLITVWMWAETGASLGAADWSAIRFTIWQAFLSALLSCVAAIPVARALARQRFIGRSAIIVLLSAPFILPVIVAVMGSEWVDQFGLVWDRSGAGIYLRIKRYFDRTCVFQHAACHTNDLARVACHSCGTFTTG